MVPIAIVIPQFPGKYNFLNFHCFGSACSDCTEDTGSSTLVVLGNFLVFYFPFSQFPTIISSFFFLKLVISLVISGVLIHFCCRNPYIVGLPLSKYLQTYWNRLLLLLISDNLGQRRKVHSLSTHVSNFLDSFYLLCYKCWLNYLSATK